MNYFRLLLAVSILSFGFASVSSSNIAFASGETYKWNGKNVIIGSGGLYESGHEFVKEGNVFKTTYGVKPADLDCTLGSGSITISGDNPNIGTLNIDYGVIGSNSCPAGTVDRFTKAVQIEGNRDEELPSDVANRRITVRVLAPKDESDGIIGNSDKVTIKRASDDKVIATTQATRKYQDDQDKGVEVKFSGLKNNIRYSACSEKLDTCESVAQITSSTSPAEAIQLNLIQIRPTIGDEDTTTCAIDGVGWIICPAMNFLAKINDQAFDFIEQFLQIQPKLYSSTPTYNAWKAFRDIANVLFVIAFLVIVYSQLTSAGISNYGIKKMLPKLVVAAILVNASYWICAIIVDVSNIIGASLYSLFENIPVGGTSGSDTQGSWEQAVGPILIGAGVGLLALMVIGPAALLAFALVMMILIARQAFVILLIVIAPVAFVAYLLPNTDQWFKKWWKALTTILMVYPIVAVIFGASSLASRILLNVSGDDQQMLAIVALGVLAVPLFAVPAVLKGALSAAGSIGQKLSGMADKAQGRASRGGTDRAKKMYENSAFARGRNLRRAGKKKYKDEKFAEALQGKGLDGGVTAWSRRRAARGFGANAAAATLGSVPVVGKIPGIKSVSESAGAQSRYIDRAAYAEANKADNEEVGFTTSQITSAAVGEAAKTPGLTARDVLKKGFAEALKSGDSVAARAHYDALRNTGEEGMEAARTALITANSSGHFSTDKGMGVKADMMKHMHANSDSIKKKDVRQDTFKNTGDFDDLDKPSNFNGLTDEQIASQTLESLKSAYAAGNLTSADATRILSNNDVASGVKGKKRIFLDSI